MNVHKMPTDKSTLVQQVTSTTDQSQKEIHNKKINKFTMTGNEKSVV
jgi:hypothetical protein